MRNAGSFVTLIGDRVASGSEEIPSSDLHGARRTGTWRVDRLREEGRKEGRKDGTRSVIAVCFLLSVA